MRHVPAVPRSATRLAALLACLSVAAAVQAPRLRASGAPGRQVAAQQAAAQAPDAQALADLVGRVKAQQAPDTRVAVFDVKAERTGGTVVVSGEVGRAAARDAVLSAFRAAGYVGVVDRIAVLPGASLGDSRFAVVTVSVANMKNKPAHAAEMANQLLMGTAVSVLKKESGWYYVQSQDDGYLGWVEPDHLALMTEGALGAFRAARHVVVTAPFGFVREQAAEQAGVVSDVVMGDVLRLKETAGGWHAVDLPDGRAGFVSAAVGADDEQWKAGLHVTPDGVERVARLLVGVPYLWGGTSPKGLDCSGLVKTVLRANGVEMPRDADQQSDRGQPVSLENGFADLRKGDLLFFGPRPGVTRITHVAIYLGGKRFIHSAGRVRFNSLDPASPEFSENLLKRLVKARRIE